jgi:hypothetical protein
MAEHIWGGKRDPFVKKGAGSRPAHFIIGENGFLYFLWEHLAIALISTVSLYALAVMVCMTTVHFNTNAMMVSRPSNVTRVAATHIVLGLDPCNY